MTDGPEGTPVRLPSDSVPRKSEDLDAAWLGSALSGSFPGLDLHDVSVTRIGEAYGLASHIYRATFTHSAPLRTGDEVPSTAVVKLWDTSTRAGTGEVDFYRDIAPQAGISIPRCHATGVDHDGQRGVLVLEDLAPCRQGDANETLDDGDLSAMLTALASFATTWWDSSDAVVSALPSVQRSPRLARLGAAGLENLRAEFVARFGRRGHPLVHRILDSAAEWLSWSDEVLADAPPTLLHLDLHLDNVVFRAPSETPYFLDWTRVATGPAAITVAELAFLMAPIGRHMEVIDRYAAALTRPVTGAGRAVDYEVDDLVRHVGGVLVRTVVTRTLGVARWIPASVREERMVENSLQRADDAVAAWLVHDPDWGPGRS